MKDYASMLQSAWLQQIREHLDTTPLNGQCSVCVFAAKASVVFKAPTSYVHRCERGTNRRAYSR